MSQAVHNDLFISGIFAGSGDGLQQIAQIVKSNGTDGELVLSFRDMDPDDLDLQEPMFIFHDGLPVPFYINSFYKKGTSKAVVKLTDINTFDDAQELLGRGVFADSRYSDDDESDFYMLEGWTLADQTGRHIGTVSDYMDIPGNPCLEISLFPQKESSCPETVLVPLHEDLIISVDESEMIITMEVPEGLV